jgi:short chain dehydrogenase
MWKRSFFSDVNERLRKNGAIAFVHRSNAFGTKREPFCTSHSYGKSGISNLRTALTTNGCILLRFAYQCKLWWLPRLLTRLKAVCLMWRAQICGHKRREDQSQNVPVFHLRMLTSSLSPTPYILSVVALGRRLAGFPISIPTILTSNMSSQPPTLPPSLSLAGKSAIVTGSSRGIGRGLALLLAQRGAAVAITYTSDHSTAQAESLSAEINALTRASIIKADLASPDCGRKVIQGALRGLGVDKNRHPRQ